MSKSLFFKKEKTVKKIKSNVFYALYNFNGFLIFYLLVFGWGKLLIENHKKLFFWIESFPESLKGLALCLVILSILGPPLAILLIYFSIPEYLNRIKKKKKLKISENQFLKKVFSLVTFGFLFLIILNFFSLEVKTVIYLLTGLYFFIFLFALLEWNPGTIPGFLLLDYKIRLTA